MFKKTERINRREYTEYFKRAKRIHDQHLTLLTVPSVERRVAVVVGKKVAKSAVKRNVIKRRVYAVLREILVENDYKGVLIVLVKPSFATLSRNAAMVYLKNFIADMTKSA
jgi:ribonuclease P protein component